jgi:hypothetical protein
MEVRFIFFAWRMRRVSLPTGESENTELHWGSEEPPRMKCFFVSALQSPDSAGGKLS